MFEKNIDKQKRLILKIKFFEDLFCIWHIFEPTLANLYAIGQMFIVVNVFLAIWSYWIQANWIQMPGLLERLQVAYPVEEGLFSV